MTRQHKALPRLLVAAAASGSGKTTVTCALLRAFISGGMSTVSFKCGPDFIDPMFHRGAVGTKASYNLDLFFTDEAAARRMLAEQSQDAQLAVIEGVMGFYDGIASTSEASACHLAKATGTPVLLIVNCRGMAASVAAMVKGFCAYRQDSGVAAVLLNQLSPSLYPEIKALVEWECGIPVAGFLPPMPDCALESRHLGLVTAQEVRGLQSKLDKLAQKARETVDLELLTKIARSAPELEYTPLETADCSGARIAVANDKAFCFYYQETLELFCRMGAELLEFSPLSDTSLPERANGLYLGGGYPELYAKELSNNRPMLKSVRDAIGAGMPTVAECGGFLYLHRSLEDEKGVSYPLVGYIPAHAYKTPKLGRFGYVTLTAQQDGLLCARGDSLRAHEFHYWDSEQSGEAFHAQKPKRKTNWDCAHTSPSLYAGFPHLYLAGAPDSAQRFLEASRKCIR